MKLNIIITIFTFLATSNGRRPRRCLPHQSCQEGDCCALGTSCRTCPHGFHVSNDLCAGRGNRQCHYAPTTMPSTTVPSRSPTTFPTGKNDPVYMGCYKNEFGDKRLDGHIGDVSIDHCDMKAAGGLFGMEYPQGFDIFGHAGCLLLTSIPVQSRVPDAECEAEKDDRGRRLGDSSRLAVYSGPRDPVYMGCYKNKFGDKRLDGHILDTSIDHCDVKAAGGLFGMEYPEGFHTLGRAECLQLSSLPNQAKVPDAECEAERDNRGRRLGNSNRLAVYRAQREDPTTSPTSGTTWDPTPSPTEMPTETPTMMPTTIPTSTPSSSPTEMPSQMPTPTPSRDPTDSPTEKPTESPTTERPTEDPISNPTFTKKPSNLPTATPTASLPTAIPTEEETECDSYYNGDWMSLSDECHCISGSVEYTDNNEGFYGGVNGCKSCDGWACGECFEGFTMNKWGMCVRERTTAEPSEDFFEMDGDCEIVDGCVQSSNYPGSYGNNEQCTIMMLRDADLIPGRRFDLETCCDHLMINGVDVESTSMVPQSLTAGTTFFFTSDYSITRGGWQICFTEMAPETMNPTSMPVSASPSQYPSKDPSSSSTFTKKPSNLPTATPTASLSTAIPTDPVYIGCYKNEFGDKRLDGHILDISIDHCDVKAAGGLFGMEYPEGFHTPGRAECLQLSSLPNQARVLDAECEAERDNRGRRLGNSNRLAVYSGPRANQGVLSREQNGQSCKEDADCLSNICDSFFCSETRSSFFGRRLMQHELMSNARKA